MSLSLVIEYADTHELCQCPGCRYVVRRAPFVLDVPGILSADDAARCAARTLDAYGVPWSDMVMTAEVEGDSTHIEFEATIRTTPIISHLLDVPEGERTCGNPDCEICVGWRSPESYFALDLNILEAT